ncbi:acyl-CoA desaturase [Hyphobacterium sp.]|uniref:acyl-CoA desaturase n=1 Tax=Hyphobacterium sp. TaxID=2004662 RepID=UPI003BA9B39F
MSCTSIPRVIAETRTDASKGTVKWSPVQSIWTFAMMAGGLIGGALTFSWDALALFFVTTAITIGLGHSLGMHRLLIHRAYKTPRWIEYTFVYLGTLVGMAGPIGMIKTHDLRDWAQRQKTCHDFFGHRRSFWVDAFHQMHCRMELDHPPRFEIEDRVAKDSFYQFLERTWRWQQLPWAVLFFLIGGWSCVFWGIALRVFVSLTGHWMVGHFAHNDGHQGWRVEGAAVQGYNVRWVGLITFGEGWHANHHAFPGSARLGLEPHQTDPGWWTLLAMKKLGLVWDIVTPEQLPARAELRRVPQEREDDAGCPVMGATARTVKRLREGTSDPNRHDILA